MKLVKKKKEKEKVKLPPWKILIVDDEPDIYTVTYAALRDFEFAGKQLQMFQAMSGIEARKILTTEPDIAVAFIDVVMETDDAGLRLVDFIRNELKYSLIRLIIRTGQPGMAPKKEVIERYDIDDYKDKTELTIDKLYTTIRIALKSYRDLTILDINQKALKKILNAALDFYHPQSLNQFFDEALIQIIDLCNIGEHISTVTSGLVLTANDGQVAVQSGIGRFSQFSENPEIETITKICSDRILGKNSNEATDVFLIPLKTHNNNPIGFVYLENTQHLSKAAHALIQIMANQCATALENLQLYHKLKEANQQTLELLTIAKKNCKETEQAHKEVESANRAKSTFLANMSHELRTPLNSILGHAQLLKRDKNLDTKQQKDISMIQHSGNYLLTLLSDILEISKIETSKIQLYPNDFYFHQFLQNIIALFQKSAEQKGISFIYEPLSHLPSIIYADEKRLRQILINLLSNAVKFTKIGGVTLKIGLQKRQDSNSRLHLNTKPCSSGSCHSILFQVEDTGIGIAAEELDKIFLPFQQQQIGDLKYCKVEGLGLGLSITKKLVETMGGTLHVESTLGQSSLFWTVLDLEVLEEVKPGQTQAAVITGFQGKPRKILVIDDEPQGRVLLINFLAPLGFKLIEASNGKEGMDKAHLYSPDLIMTDLIMPIMDGFELTRQIRKRPEIFDGPIIAISSNLLNVTRQTGLELGCSDFISRPIHIDVLLKLLQKHLKLTWTYDTEPYNNSTINKEAKNYPNTFSSNTEIALKAKQAEKEMELINLPAEQAAILLKLVMIGDITGIIEQADNLKQIDKQFVPIAHEIEQLANNFDIEQIGELLEPFMN
ncbi:response regulator [Candidatus Parabeggiatoa sp. HSG14]|uniref:response regulator n=1 Tax=Candidatus Parabeggiatoa sp. HSG14 TaxID=3055593 RepID=UPI0025A8B2E5|nr:response regulator [Thiotrichales bacterium HSG14]